jgi:hypothetical protein
LHLGLLAAVALCGSGFIVEVFRALGGNELSWAYVFEWPLLLVYGVFMWRRLVRDEMEGNHEHPTPPRRHLGAKAAQRANRRRAEEDAALERWNAYLAEVRAAEDHRTPKTPG